MSKVFPKYPEIYHEFIERSLKHYENMRESVLKHKQNHIDVVNKQTTYDIIQLRQKNPDELQSEKIVDTNSFIEVFVDRIATIDDEIRRFENAMGDACLSITKDMRRFLHRVN